MPCIQQYLSSSDKVNLDSAKPQFGKTDFSYRKPALKFPEALWSHFQGAINQACMQTFHAARSYKYRVHVLKACIFPVKMKDRVLALLST